jgi:hypothetical protein
VKRVLCFCSVLVLFTGCNRLQLKTNLSNQNKINSDTSTTVTATPLVLAPPEEPYQTPDPNAPTRTPNPDIPTRTPTITFTPAPSPTATLDPDDPISYLGDPWFRDTFRSGANFFLYDEPQSSYQVENDQMILVAKKANNFETWSLASPTLYNFYLEITGTFGEKCSGKDRYGLIFRAPKTTEGYLLSISCDGSYRLSTWEDAEEKYTSLIPWTTCEEIQGGPGGENRLGIKTDGITLTVFINGKQINDVTDSTFGAGRFGVLVAAADTPGFTAYLSEIAYWALK